MTRDSYVIRQMTPADLGTVIEWAASEGWNPGLHDAASFYAADPTGFYVGVLNGEIIGSISAVKYGADYAFWGYFIVKPEHRAKKYGLRLWQQAEAALGGAVAGLDGVLAQVGNYARSGFVDVYHNQRYQGVVSASRAIDPHVAPYTPADLDTIERYDRACVPAPRRVFLEGWLAQPEAHTLLYKDSDAVRGYGVLRPAREGHRFGPLFADDAPTAEALFDALVSRVPTGSPVFIDLPQPNAAALDLVARRGMTPVFETARMYRGAVPQPDLQKVFGVTSLELG